jgi:hypothetical protein
MLGRDPDRCNEEVRLIVHQDAIERGDAEAACWTTRPNWLSQRELDLWDETKPDGLLRSGPPLRSPLEGVYGEREQEELGR